MRVSAGVKFAELAGEIASKRVQAFVFEEF